MKELINKLIPNIHWLILLYALYSAWGMYEAHILQVEAANGKIASAEAKINKLKKQLAEIEDFTKQADEYRTRIEEVAKNIEAVQKQLPSETNDSQIIGYLKSEIEALNIKDSNFSPGKDEKSTYYISKDYKIKASGTFLQFLIFMERIASADRIYNVKEIKLTTPSGVQKGRFQMISLDGVIQAFRMNPEFKVDRGTKK